MSAKEHLREQRATRFENGCFDEWVTASTAYHRFEPRGLQAGVVTKLCATLPAGGWPTVRVEVEVQPGEGAYLACRCDRFEVSLHVAPPSSGVVPRNRITKNRAAPLADVPARLPETEGAHTVAFEFGPRRLAGILAGAPVIESETPAPDPLYMGHVELDIWDGCLVRSLRLLTDDAPRALPFTIGPKKDDAFCLEVNVDFYDDLIRAPFTLDMFDQLFDEFRRWGVRRCHWIYYGGARHGLLRNTPGIVAAHAAETIANTGGIFPAAVRAAHAHGIELYGLLKPFEMGFWNSLPPGHPEAAAREGTGRIGGPKICMADFVADRPDLLMARNPSAVGKARNQRITRMDLVKEDDAPCAFDPQRIKLFVSADNADWRPYTGPMDLVETVEETAIREAAPSGFRYTDRTSRVRIIRFSGLEIDDPFVAVVAPGRRQSFVNTLVNLVRIFGDAGEEHIYTLGVVARTPTRSGGTTDKRRGHPIPFGVEFDVVPGTPTAVFPGYDAIAAPHALDGGDGLLAVAMGNDATSVACLSPSHEEVRAWWLGWLCDCLDAGADGIELRMRHHHSPFSWSEFGFERPVVEAFQRRYGVDLRTTDAFDRAARRRVRGEAYTQFCREARALTKARGAGMGVHVSVSMDMPVSEGGAMDMHWDWPTWLREGLADSITLKEIWPGTRFEREVMHIARAQGIRAIFCPYANNIWSRPGGERMVRDRIRAARAAGHDGFQYYECASVVHAHADGTIEMTQPALREVFRKEFPSDR